MLAIYNQYNNNPKLFYLTGLTVINKVWLLFSHIPAKKAIEGNLN